MVGHGVEDVTEVVNVCLEGETLGLDGMSKTFRNLISEREVAEADIVELLEPVVVDDSIAPAVGIVCPGRLVARIDFTEIVNFLESHTVFRDIADTVDSDLECTSIRLRDLGTIREETFGNDTVIIGETIPTGSISNTAVICVSTLEGCTEVAVCCTIVGRIGSYIAAETGIKAGMKSEPLVTDVGIDGSEEVRNRIADFFDLSVTTDKGGTVVLLPVVKNRETGTAGDVAIIVIVVVLERCRIGHEDTIGTAYLCDRTDTEVTIVGIAFEFNVVGYEIGKFNNLGPVLGESEVDVPGEILGLDGNSVDCELDTLVLNVTCIDVCSVDTGSTRESDLHDLVAGILLVEGSVDADTAVEHTEVSTDFP